MDAKTTEPTMRTTDVRKFALGDRHVEACANGDPALAIYVSGSAGYMRLEEAERLAELLACAIRHAKGL